MLIYQLQHRIIMKKEDKEIIFPNEAEIEIYLEPTGQFGIGTDLGRTVVQYSKCVASYNANTGKSHIKSSNAFLKPVNVTVGFKNLKIKLKGNILTAKADCKNYEDLNNLLIFAHYKLPVLLNLELFEAPVVKRTQGKIGNVAFIWELKEHLDWRYDVTNHEQQEQRMRSSLLNTGIVMQNRKLDASLSYFYLAQRLSESGNSPFEFMAEVVLNLCKVLEALFGDVHDDVRKELLNFDYSKTEIEEKFIAIMKLRDAFDVGHISLALFKQKHLDAMHRYLINEKEVFRELLRRVITKLEKQEYLLPDESSLYLRGESLRKWKRLVDIFEKAQAI